MARFQNPNIPDDDLVWMRKARCTDALVNPEWFFAEGEWRMVTISQGRKGYMSAL